MMFLTNKQNEKVKQIVSYYENGSKKVLFSAPTGSGKTFMIANVISRIKEIYEQKETNKKKVVFVIMTISVAELPRAMSEKLKEYKPWLPTDIGNISYIQSASSQSFGADEDVHLSPKNSDVIIFGNSSFKRNTTYYQRGLTDSFLYEVDEDYDLIYIRDEAHYAASSNLTKEEKDFERKLEEISAFTLKMSATLKEYNDEQVTLTESELKSDNLYLLKTIEKKHFGISDKGDDDSDEVIKNMTEMEYFEKAIKSFKNIKKQYENFDINPAAIIQVKDKTVLNPKEFENNLSKVKRIIDDNNLIYSIYFSDLKESNSNAVNPNSLKEIASPKSPVDVVIIKVGPSIGWDIPRANTLIQIRDVQSEDLNKQLVGRIRRNPRKDLSFNEITNKYYLFSSYQMGKRGMASYSIKNKFRDLVFYRGEIEFDEDILKSIIFEDEEILKIVKSNNDQILEKISDAKKKNTIFHTYENLEDDGKKINKGIYISDFIDLNKFMKQTLLKDKVIFEKISEFLDDCDSICENDKFLYYYFVSQTYLREIKKSIYSKINNKNWGSALHLDAKIPANYSIFKNKNNDYVSFGSVEEVYAYLNNDKNEKTKQFLDSRPEVKFLEKAISEVDESLIEGGNIEVLFKNPTQYNRVFFEYIDFESKKRKSFVDFVLKNGDKHLYIEVKGIKDYDHRKTDSIKKAFEAYSKENSTVDVIFGLVWVGDKEDNYQMKMNFNSTKGIEVKTIKQAISYIMKK